ncbi:MAG: DNA/RNA nuclease SfsA [Cohaesibacteraceae bacterium]|nr:DNA/RNA nuclease SfsA [Cohaesibacteraceae bacterium]MBL4876043.1 DNA/RNA nuclease SfsA [Cohaesibacteraceae bacterium]
MNYQSPLVSGTLVKRYKRFLADIELHSGELITAHCANPGSMMGLSSPGSKVWLSRSTNTKRKLPFTWELIEVNGGYVGVNTALPNRIVEEAISNNKIDTFSDYDTVRREVKYGSNSRIDLLLENQSGQCFIEIKSVSLSRTQGLAEFPDSVTKRGAKHLDELAQIIAPGVRACMVYLVQRPDCTDFSLADDIDPVYAARFSEAKKYGVESFAFQCVISPTNISLGRSVNILMGK